MKRCSTLLMFTVSTLLAAPAYANETTVIRQTNGAVSVVRSNNGTTQVVNGGGRGTTSSYRSHEEVVKSLTRPGSQVIRQGR